MDKNKAIVVNTKLILTYFVNTIFNFLNEDVKAEVIRKSKFNDSSVVKLSIYIYLILYIYIIIYIYREQNNNVEFKFFVIYIYILIIFSLFILIFIERFYIYIN